MAEQSHHKAEVAGSTPAPATISAVQLSEVSSFAVE